MPNLKTSKRALDVPHVTAAIRNVPSHQALSQLSTNCRN